MLLAMLPAVAVLGTRSIAALVGGGVAVVLGFVGFALILSVVRHPESSPGQTRNVFRIVASTLLVVVGASVLIGIGIVEPLGTLKARQSYSLVAQHRRSIEMHEQATRRLDELHQENVQLISENNRILQHISGSQGHHYRQLVLNEPKHQDPKRLSMHNHKVTSQNGEDGIIAEIFRRIGTTNRHFVEFGAANGAENNTVHLVRQGWSGLWIDADAELVNMAKEYFRPVIEEEGRLTVMEAFISAENIEDLFAQGHVPEEPDLLSIDIDRNDYHVWKAITRYRPRVVIVEYNAGIVPTEFWVVPYDPDAFGFTSKGNGNGASLKALEELGAEKGYSLVGCDLSGVNAFFIRDDLLDDHFVAPYTSENHYEPFRFFQMPH